MPIEPHDVPLGMLSPEALQMTTDATRRCYVLPETMGTPKSGPNAWSLLIWFRLSAWLRQNRHHTMMR